MSLDPIKIVESQCANSTYDTHTDNSRDCYPCYDTCTWTTITTIWGWPSALIAWTDTTGALELEIRRHLRCTCAVQLDANILLSALHILIMAALHIYWWWRWGWRWRWRWRESLWTRIFGGPFQMIPKHRIFCGDGCFQFPYVCCDMYVCMYVCMYVYVCVSVYVYVYVYVCVSVYVYVYLCMCMCICVYLFQNVNFNQNTDKHRSARSTGADTGFIITFAGGEMRRQTSIEFICDLSTSNIFPSLLLSFNPNSTFYLLICFLCFWFTWILFNFVVSVTHARTHT